MKYSNRTFAKYIIDFFHEKGIKYVCIAPGSRNTPLTEAFINQCLDAGKITYASSQVSSRASNYYKYENFDYIVCNEHESKLITRDENVCVTKGNKGCTMNGVDYLPYPVKNPLNTIGAGDCFYAALLATGDPDFANKKASEFVASEVYE